MQFITTDNRIAVENFQIGYFYTITFNNHNYIITTCTGKGDNFVSFLCSEPEIVFDLTMQTADSIATIELYGGGTGTTDYNNLSNKPSINNVLLVGNKTTSDLLINDVPAVTSADDSKILMSSYSGGVGSYSWETYSPISSYDDLNDKPTINSITLSGNKTSSDLGLQSEINSENLLLSDNVDDTNQTHKFATAAQLEQIATNETNISSVQTELTTNQNDGFTKNSQIFDIEKWRTVGTHNGNTVINSDNSVTITATASDCYTGYTPNGTPNYPEQAKISVSHGDKIYMTWTSDSDEQKGRVFIFGNADTTKTVNAYNNAGSLTYNVPSGVTFITFRLGVTTSENSLTYSNIMISKQQGATYQQYTPSNRELYEMILNL